jgi:hypothetical protein
MLIQGSYVPMVFRKAVRTSIDSLDSFESGKRKHVQSNLPSAPDSKFSIDPDPWSRNKRPKTDETSWRSVGEAYVHGIMHGEAVNGRTLPLETIHVI